MDKNLFFRYLKCVTLIFICTNSLLLKANIDPSDNDEQVNSLHAELYAKMKLEDYHLSQQAFLYAVNGLYNLKKNDETICDSIVSVIDFTQPSTKKRLYVLDIKNGVILYNTYVSHGRNSGQNYADSFSNVSSSYQSSLGFYKTAETYHGKHGYSLRLDGQEENFNSNVRSRAVVIHAAGYVSEDFIKKYGRLGRSHGCPALPEHLSREIIDTIKNGSIIFAFSNNDAYLNSSTLIKY